MHNLDNLQLSISSQAFADEGKCVCSMLASLGGLEGSRDRIFARAGKLVSGIRSQNSGAGIENFLHTYSLSTHEGVAIMCLAEALLRIPDHVTADRLIEDKLADADWGRYLGTGESFFMSASSWGLLLAGKVVDLATADEKTPSAIMGKLIGRAGESVVREALKHSMRFIGSQFVLGEDIEEAVHKSEAHENAGYRFSYDMLGEGARTHEQAEAYVKSYHHTIGIIAKHAKGSSGMEAPGISLKLSALHPRYTLVNEERVMRELYPRLADIVKLAMDAGINVSIDAEEASRLDIEIKLFCRLFSDPLFKGYEGIGFVMQAYQKRAFPLLDYLAELSRQVKKRMPLRLVKGAYWDSEIKNAQVLGLPSYPVFTRKEHTDVSYLACAQKIIQNMDSFYPQFATHNALTVASVMEMAGAKRGFEFQRLQGMGEQLHNQIIGEVPCRIYAPVGKHKDLLPYLIRRLLENGANTSFVSLLMDKHKPLAELLEDPGTSVRKHGGSQNEAIPNPEKLYTNRKNSQGLDLGNLQMLNDISSRIAEFKDCFWHAEPTFSTVRLGAKPRNITEPADENRVVGYALNESVENVGRTIAVAKAAFTNWRKVTMHERVAIIEKFAELLARNHIEAMALIMREGGKTASDAIAEVREAIDFCNYYAAQAKAIAENKLEGPTGEQNTIELTARGVFACISPWNFPLAIFTGQIVAALITGNTVIAKPAEQTPLTAAFAVNLLHDAGIPEDVLQLMTGSGSSIGAALTKSEDIAGVVFTGSMETARLINRTLAARDGAIAVLIAETGGQNCMMVDSSALLEQVTDDVITSAFGSTGQRCSALRILYVQEEIADDLIRLIAGAMKELKVSNPFFDVSADVGPVIDTEAYEKLQKHIKKMNKTARLIAVSPLDTKTTELGHYIAPHMFEIQSIHELKEEVFGPVLHVIRYQSSEADKIFDEVNSTGYGLTFGLQSRIEEEIDRVRGRIHAGNIYINRSMIGATVGVQPFGGEGLSGTGPKAGGPLYLLRFMTERTYTVNTAAIGGNLELLSGRNNQR